MSTASLLVGFLWTALAYVLAGLVALFVKTRRKIEGEPDPWRRNDFSEVKSFLSALLRRGYDGGYVALTHEESGRFLCLRKVIPAEGYYGLELCIPRPDLSETQFDTLKAYCVEAKLPHRMESATFKENPTRILAVDCGQDVDRAYELAAMVWTRLFGQRTDGWYEREWDGISVHDELVDSPDHARLSEEEILQHRWHRLKQRYRQVNLTFTDVFYAVALTLLAVISIIGLPIATLISIGDPPDWAVDLGGVTLAGSSASFNFLLAYLFSFAVLRQLIKEKFKHLTGCTESRYERFYGVGLRFIVVTLPLAVILIWTGI